MTDPDAAFLAGEVAAAAQTTRYRLLTPEPLEPGRRYPLVLFLHGAGERGGDNTKQLTHFPRRMASSARRAEFPCYVLAPQCPEDERWTLDEWGATTSRPLDAEPTGPMAGAIAALHEVTRMHAVDPERVYLTGLSMGGYGAVQLALRHADWFAAVAPVCGGGDEREAARLAGLPLSFWHGDVDRAVPVIRSRDLVSALRALGASPEYHELAGVGHDAWNHAYADDGCLPWLFAQRRDPVARLNEATRLLGEALPPNARIAFLGDSITQSGAAAGGYVDLMRRALAATRPEVSVIPAGISGNRVPDLLARYQRDVLAAKPTHVFVYIGINDVWHSLSGRGTSSAEFTSGLTKLCDDLEAHGAEIVLATASVIGELPPGQNQLDAKLDEFVGLTRAVAASGNRIVCDLHGVFDAHLAQFHHTAEAEGTLTTDGVHLNSAGNTLVATEAALALRAACSNDGR